MDTRYLVRALVFATVAIALLLTGPRSGQSSSNQQPPMPIRSAIPPVATPPTRASAAVTARDQLVGVWIYADPTTTMQLQIRSWNAGSAPTALYVVTARPPFTAIYEGSLSQRAHALLALFLVKASSTTLPRGYSWCQRLSGDLTTTTRAGELYLDLAPDCSGGHGSSIVNHRGRPSTGAVPSILLDAGTRGLLLSRSSHDTKGSQSEHPK